MAWRAQKKLGTGYWLGVALLLCALAGPAPAADDAESLPADLLGSWHSTSIDGDALFLIVSSFQVDLEAGGTFRAHVAFTDGEKKAFPGTWEPVSANEVKLTIHGVGKETVSWKRTGPDTLRLSDPSFGVHFDLRRGHARKPSGARWF